MALCSIVLKDVEAEKEYYILHYKKQRKKEKDN